MSEKQWMQPNKKLEGVLFDRNPEKQRQQSNKKAMAAIK
jgi:hypothetical protein